MLSVRIDSVKEQKPAALNRGAFCPKSTNRPKRFHRRHHLFVANTVEVVYLLSRYGVGLSIIRPEQSVGRLRLQYEETYSVDNHVLIRSGNAVVWSRPSIVCG